MSSPTIETTPIRIAFDDRSLAANAGPLLQDTLPSISVCPNLLTDASPSPELSSCNPIQDEATKTADGAVTPAKIANMNGPNGLVLAADIIWPIYARHQRERFAPF